jgi:hypothetical protein
MRWPGTWRGGWVTPRPCWRSDETGFLKKAKMSAGVARMYTGTAGRVENCQVGVFTAYVTPDGGRALIDRELYLPEGRGDDRDRCRRAGIGGKVAFATKPELARTMIGRAVAAGIPFSWVTADEAHGGNAKLRVAGGAGHPVRDGGLPRRQDRHGSREQARGRARRPGPQARVAAAELRRRLQGARLYDWALIAAKSGQHHLLARRSLQPNEKGVLELAFFRCWSPRPRCPGQARGGRGHALGVWRTVSPRPRTRPAWTTTRSASTPPGTGTPPLPCSPMPSSPSPPAAPGQERPRALAQPAGATAPPLKRGPDPCGQPFAPPRT